MKRFRNFRKNPATRLRAQPKISVNTCRQQSTEETLRHFSRESCDAMPTILKKSRGKEMLSESCDFTQSLNEDARLISLCEDFLRLNEMMSQVDMPCANPSFTSAVGVRWWSLLAEIDGLPARTERGRMLKLRATVARVHAAADCLF